MNNWWFMSDKLMYLLFPFTILIVFRLWISRRLIYDGIDKEICVKNWRMVNQLLHNRHFNGKALPNPNAMRCSKRIRPRIWHQRNAFSKINTFAVCVRWENHEIENTPWLLKPANDKSGKCSSNYWAYPAHMYIFLLHRVELQITMFLRVLMLICSYPSRNSFTIHQRALIKNLNSNNWQFEPIN